MVVMLAGLYTVRVVLKTLGAEDYGIYGAAAGGAVAVFGFVVYIIEKNEGMDLCIA